MHFFFVAFVAPPIVIKNANKVGTLASTTAENAEGLPIRFPEMTKKKGNKSIRLMDIYEFT